MEKFYEDKDIVERYNNNYKGKNMGEIMEIEKKLFDEERPKIDAAHEKWLEERKGMMTV